MKSPEATIPALREDVAARRYGGRIVVEDPIRRVRVPLDALGLRVAEALAAGPTTPRALCRALGASRVEVWRRIVFFARSLLLQSRRAHDHCELARGAGDTSLWSRDRLGAAPLRFPGGLRHACVACGGCCHGSDIGPLTERDVANIQAVDWRPHLPDVAPEDWLVEVDGPSGQPILLTGSKEGRCVFLDASRLCTIHKVAGGDKKPATCQQFPFTFTRTPSGVDVSYSMECRAWWRAKRDAPPVEEDAPAIRRLLAAGGPVVDLPTVIPVAAGLDLSVAAWEGLREELLDGARGATSFPELVTAVVLPARRLRAAMDGVYGDDERFVEREAWALPAAAAGATGAAEGFIGSCEALAGELRRGLDELARAFREAARYDEADRADRLAWAVTALLSGRRVEDLLRFEDELEIWRDMALAALHGHEVVRRATLEHGIAMLALRLLAGRLLAGLLATTSLRGRTSEQDVVDAMVLVTKVPRGTAFARLFLAQQSPLADLFVDNVEVFARGDAPRPPYRRWPV